MYYGVTDTFINEIVIKKSRFITTLMPVTDARDAENKLRQIRSQYRDATHNCYAYIADAGAGAMRYSDDGEPQGTAGAPMLEVLKRRGLGYTLAVVTRYFGGVKLGAGGLVGAYTDSVAMTLAIADIGKFVMSAVARTAAPYALDKRLGAYFESIGKVLGKSYGAGVEFVIAVPEERIHELEAYVRDATSGAGTLEIVDRRYIAY